jgi:ABC-type Fe3+-hydroxamate transport system substrate-binding protein
MASPRRIVSLCPSITETIVALGGLKRLVAATRFCVRPQGLLWGLPRIGGTKDPRISQILDLKPDIVFANEEENRLEDVRALVDAGVEVDVSFPKTVSEVPAAIRSWGARLDAASEGEAIASRIEGELRSLESSPPSMPFLYACWIWKDPWMTVSDDTYVATTPEESLARGADVHFFPSEPFPFKADKHGAEIEKLFGSEKVRLFVEGDNLTWHGVRTLDGLAQMRKLREELAR